jgi:predicted alpha/beta-hydrolase family hydrolase
VFETPHGPAQVHFHPAMHPRAALVLGHGAGGGVGAPDLIVARDVALAAGITVALVEQPYRVAGRRTPPRAPALDAAWIAVIEALRAEVIGDAPLLVGGRSSGARVACRTATATEARAVLCLAFPLRPPRNPDRPPAASRLPELEAVTVPVLIVQGTSDPFGVPQPGPRREVAQVAGDHGLKADLPAIASAVGDWLHELAPLLDA